MDWKLMSISRDMFGTWAYNCLLGCGDWGIATEEEALDRFLNHRCYGEGDHDGDTAALEE